MVSTTASSDGRVEVGSASPAPSEPEMVAAEPASAEAEAVMSAQTSSGFARFADFVRAQAVSAKRNGSTPSATLVNPGMLDGERRQCGELPPAVLIDIDQEDEIFELHDAYSTPQDLPDVLDEIRDSGVVIGWVSGAGTEQFGTLRFALSQTGLDRTGNDQLLLLEYAGERKQTRRDAFSKSHCVLAIAGDTRADFDELFLYLKSSDAAQPLDAMIGDGWFITPQALTKQ